MSEKKPPAGTPSGATPPGGSFEQEFEKFLRDEATQVGAVYRKLPQAEPDAQLDARVRALAHGALRESSSSQREAPAPAAAPAGLARRWVPAFASAAVLVLAAGIAWRMGPQNWAQKETARSTSVEATVPASAPTAATTSASASSPPTPALASQVGDTHGDKASASPMRATEANREIAADKPLPFPAMKVPPRDNAADASGGAPASQSLAELRKSESVHNAAASAADSRVAGVHPGAQPMGSDEQRARTEVDAAHSRLQRAPGITAVAPSAGASAARNGSAAASNGAIAGTAAQMEPPKLAPSESKPYASKAKATAPAPAAPPPPPVIADEATPMQALAAPAPAPPPADALRRDETDAKKTAQREAEIADRETLSSAAKSQATTAPPPVSASPPVSAAPPAPPAPPPPQPETRFAPEPSAAAGVPAPKPVPNERAERTQEAQKQAYSDHFAVPDGTAQANIPGRPTGAQLAAWPRPKCRSPGTVIANSGGVESRIWNYPPEVPESAHLRISIVKGFLDVESREGALKAYEDFRACYPEDKWPESLLRRLGTQ